MTRWQDGWWDDPDWWDRTGHDDQLVRRRALYESGGVAFPHLPTLAELWIDELHEVGLAKADPSTGALPKQAGSHADDRVSLDDARPVRLPSGKILWLKLNGERTDQGYRQVEVSDEPMRTDAAMVAACAVLECAVLEQGEVEDETEQLRVLLRARGVERLKGPLSEQVLADASETRNARPEEHGKDLERLHLRTLEYALALLRDRRPGFDDLNLDDQLGLLRKAASHAIAVAAASLNLMKFLEYGTPRALPSRALETAGRQVEAALLRDVAGLRWREVAEKMGIPKPSNYEIKRDVPYARTLAKKGRGLLSAALGDEGWQEQIEAKKAEMWWWQSLDGEQQRAVRFAERFERVVGSGRLLEVLRQRALGVPGESIASDEE